LAVVAVAAAMAGSGDVKYHLGTSYNRPTVNGKMVHLSLMANPSHLEVIIVITLCHDMFAVPAHAAGHQQLSLHEVHLAAVLHLELPDINSLPVRVTSCMMHHKGAQQCLLSN
jgi:hypothetical protein